MRTEIGAEAADCQPAVRIEATDDIAGELRFVRQQGVGIWPSNWMPVHHTEGQRCWRCHISICVASNKAYVEAVSLVCDSAGEVGIGAGFKIECQRTQSEAFAGIQGKRVGGLRRTSRKSPGPANLSGSGVIRECYVCIWRSVGVGVQLHGNGLYIAIVSA